MAKSKYPHLSLRGNVWWIEVNNATYGRIRETTGCTNEDQANLVLQARLGQVATDRLQGVTTASKQSGVGKGSLTLLEGYQKALKEHWQRDTSSSATVEHNWKSVARHFNTSVPLKDVTRAMLVEFVGKLLAEGDSKGTVNRKLSVISTILTKAADEWEILDSLPKVPTLKEPKNVRLPMSPTDKAKALAYLELGKGKHDADVAAFIEVSWGCGARLNEIVSMEDHQLDFDKGTMSIWDTKNDEARVLPMTPKVQAILAQRSGSGKPFGTLNKDCVDHVWARTREACGISKRVCIHSIRHTVVSKLIDADLSLSKVMAYVGHKRIETTKRYTHLASTSLSDCAKVLE